MAGLYQIVTVKKIAILTAVRRLTVHQKMVLTIIALLGVIGLSFHLQAAWHQQLFGDEVHSLFFFHSHSWGELFSQPLEPVHPNGYYLLLKLWYALTPSVLALRLWQVLLFGATLIATLLLGKKLRFSLPGQIMFFSLISSSAYLWHFSFQLRMYGVGMLLIVLSILALWHKRPWLSVLLDWLSIFCVYGASLFVIAKWLTYGVLKQKNSSPVLSRLVPGIFGTLPVIWVATQFWHQQQHIDTNFLYWVHIPQFPDWSLGLISMLSGMFLPYFEGYSALGMRWIQLGFLTNIFALIGVMFVGGMSWYYRKNMVNWWNQIDWNERFLLLLSLQLLVFYTILFAASLTLGGHLFHIRQIFPVGLVFFLLLGWLTNLLWKYAPSITLAGILVFMSLNLMGIAGDSLGPRQAYPHHFTQKPGTPLVATPSDVELLYKQCHTFSRSQAQESCRQQNITLINAPWTPPTEWTAWWMTPRAQEFVQYDCNTVSIDYVSCQIETNQ